MNAERNTVAVARALTFRNCGVQPVIARAMLWCRGVKFLMQPQACPPPQAAQISPVPACLPTG